MTATPDRVIVQRFVHGDLMGYDGLWGDDGPIAEFTAVEHKARSNPLGPTAIVTTCDDPALLELGRTVVKTLGCRGLVAIECVVDRDNTYHVIDVSPRAWGSFMAYAQAGVDFAAAYARSLVDEPSDPLPSHTCPGRTIRVVPAALTDDALTEPFGAVLTQSARDLRPYACRLGLRYRLVAAVCALRARHTQRKSRPSA